VPVHRAQVGRLSGAARRRVAAVRMYVLDNVLAPVAKGFTEVVTTAIRTISVQADVAHVHEQVVVIVGNFRSSPRGCSPARATPPAQPRSGR
jgi:hypothetical protein